jgi:hypothetical protein
MDTGLTPEHKAKIELLRSGNLVTDGRATKAFLEGRLACMKEAIRAGVDEIVAHYERDKAEIQDLRGLFYQVTQLRMELGEEEWLIRSKAIEQCNAMSPDVDVPGSEDHHRTNLMLAAVEDALMSRPLAECTLCWTPERAASILITLAEGCRMAGIPMPTSIDPFRAKGEAIG